jgi:hypothetical protein
MDRKRKIAIILDEKGLPKVKTLKKYNPIHSETNVVKTIIDTLIEKEYFKKEELERFQKGKRIRNELFDKVVVLAQLLNRQGFSSYWLHLIGRNRCVMTHYLQAYIDKKVQSKLEEKIISILSNNQSIIKLIKDEKN